MFGLLTRSPEVAPETPVTIPKYRADDLPSVIQGRVTLQDLRKTNYRRQDDSCAVAMSLRRIFPGIEEGYFSIGIERHVIGDRVYDCNSGGRRGIWAWILHLHIPFNYTLTELYRY